MRTVRLSSDVKEVQHLHTSGTLTETSNVFDGIDKFKKVAEFSTGKK